MVKCLKANNNENPSPPSPLFGSPAQRRGVDFFMSCIIRLISHLTVFFQGDVTAGGVSRCC